MKHLHRIKQLLDEGDASDTITLKQAITFAVLGTFFIYLAILCS